MQFAAGDFAHELPDGTRVYPFAYWLGLVAEDAARNRSASDGFQRDAGTLIAPDRSKPLRHGRVRVSAPTCPSPYEAGSYA